jgi:hypothetical protein
VNRYQTAVVGGSVTGAIIALIMCIAFGIFDVQCRGEPAGPYWNAERQACQAHEVTP